MRTAALETAAAFSWEAFRARVREQWAEMLDKLDKPVVLMHPGPINRGVELSSDAADSGHSVILDQVENGVAVRMAVLYLLLGGAEGA